MCHLRASLTVESTSGHPGTFTLSSSLLYSAPTFSSLYDTIWTLTSVLMHTLIHAHSCICMHKHTHSLTLIHVPTRSNLPRFSLALNLRLNSEPSGKLCRRPVQACWCPRNIRWPEESWPTHVDVMRMGKVKSKPSASARTCSGKILEVGD